MFPIKNETELVTLKGIIVPVDWDSKGNAVAIAISTHGEDEYLICKDNKGKELFNFIQDLVKVKGKISEVSGIKSIKINNMEKCILDIADETNNSMNL